MTGFLYFAKYLKLRSMLKVTSPFLSDAGICGASENSGMLSIDKLEELPFTVFQVNRKVANSDSQSHTLILLQLFPWRFFEGFAFNN